MKKQTRMVREVVAAILITPFAVVAMAFGLVVYAAMSAVDLLWPEDPETMTEEEKRRYFGYRKGW